MSGLAWLLALVIGSTAAARPTHPHSTPQDAPAPQDPAGDEVEAGALHALALRCSEGIPWAESWEDAVARSRDSGAPVLVYGFRYPGFELGVQAAGALFLDPDVAELVNARFVPLLLELGVGLPFEEPEIYGMSGTTFGSAALLVSNEGRVLREAPGASYELLLEWLADLGEGLDRSETHSGDPLERAALHLARGELERAAKLLEKPANARAFQLQASIHRRRRDGTAALAALDRARVSTGGEELATDLDLDRAQVLHAMGRFAESRALADGIVAPEPAQARIPEALFLLGALRFELEGASAAEETWRALARSHAESPWAWRAAALLESAAFELGSLGRLDWPPEELRELAPTLEPEPLSAAQGSQSVRASRDAVAFLIARQNADGSWLGPGEAERRPTAGADELEVAVSALCTRALLRHSSARGAAPAIERALAFLLAAYERMHSAPPQPSFMDYSVWSLPCLIDLFCECVEKDLRERADLEPVLARLFADLVARQREIGGWSYYASSDPTTDQPTLEIAMSFTTAAVLRACLHAKSAGFEPPQELLERGLDCLERMRDEEGDFAYLAWSTDAIDTNPEGAAGRAPTCELALLDGGRSSAERVRQALDIFLAHRGTYSKELGKSLMHTGPDGQGSHYLLFDYAGAAASLGAIERRERARYRAALLEDVLRAHREGGAFVDNPMLGTASGTALALLALAELEQSE